MTEEIGQGGIGAYGMLWSKPILKKKKSYPLLSLLI